MIDISVSELECYESAFTALAVEIVQIIACQLFECACSGAMQNSHFAGAYHLRIVEICYQCFRRFIDTHSPKVEYPFEGNRSTVHDRCTDRPLR